MLKQLAKSYAIVALLCCSWVIAKENKPLAQAGNFEYLGAFKFPKMTYGASSLAYADGTITYNSDNDSLFIVGKIKEQAIGEYAIPKLTKSLELKALESAQNIQPFVRVFEHPTLNNPQRIDRITGMIFLENQLFVNAIKYYDAPAKNTHTSLRFIQANALQKSPLTGFYSITGAAHAAGWLSKIPNDWQTLLDAKYISGNASNTPISGRHSIGPSAFTIKSLMELPLEGRSIDATALMDYDLKHRLHPDYYNEEGGNDIWTVASRAQYGFIIPRTKTYAVFGSLGGLTSPLGYKILQKSGRRCPGPCAYDASDYYNYIWLYNIDDLIKVKQNKLLPYQVRPYAYGKFPVPFDTTKNNKGKQKFHRISGGAFDEKSNTLYLSLKRADVKAKQPVIVAYKVNL